MSLSVQEVKKILDECPVDLLSQKLNEFREDQRKGIVKLVLSGEKKLLAYAKEQERLEHMLTYERACYEKGYHRVGGTDEAGRGPLAGPVSAAVVVLPEECKIVGVNDSKKLSAKKRDELYDIIREEAEDFAVAMVFPKRIDEINILQATYEAMRTAVSQLKQPLDFLLADAVTIPRLEVPQEGIIQGDAKSMSIACASILAKVERDRLMIQMDEMYPQYGFASHKGYGSAAHIEAIEKYGLCPIHRRSFVKNILEKKKTTTRDKGNMGENIAVHEMEKKGYDIIERNYRGTQGEIDIIAKKDTYIVFTEVKYRMSQQAGSPAEAVTKNKQERIRQTALAYIAEWNLTELDFRFDVAEIAEMNGKKMFRYIENAF